MFPKNPHRIPSGTYPAHSDKLGDLHRRGLPPYRPHVLTQQ